jgi:farnesyl diphosphate synthase
VNYNVVDIKNFLNNIQNIIATKLSEILKTNPAPCARLQQALEYTALSDGKRLRPALMYALADTTVKHQNLLQNAACAVELVHTYSIIHDDLPAMDDDDFRRGKPSCHIEFDEATAILVGDSLQSLAFYLLSLSYHECDNNNNNINVLQKQIKIINILSEAIGALGMVAGQSLELSQQNNEYHNAVNLEALNQIHKLKTGKLFTACLQIAAIIANLNSEQYDITTCLGYKLGLAFQIQDDILDCLQNSEVLGKPTHSDLKRNLPTYANIINSEEAHDILNNLWTESYQLIEQLKLPSTTLKNLVQYIQNRTY